MTREHVTTRCDWVCMHCVRVGSDISFVASARWYAGGHNRMDVRTSFDVFSIPRLDFSYDAAAW